MPIQEFNGFSNRALRLGPEQNTFEGTDLANAESIRDSYFSSNPSKLAIYDANSSLMIRLAYTTVDGSTVKFMVRIAGDWVDYTPVVQGLPGEVASLVGVPIGEIPYKLIDGTFGGSNMRVLEDGRVLAPPGFTVESGSVTFGEAITLSEISGFLGISNHLNNREYTVVDFYTPPDSASSPPTIFHLIEPAFEFIAQSNDSTNLPNNPLIFNYTVQNTARSRALKFRTYAAMTNVRIKISLVSNGIALKHIPSQQAWEESTGGLNWILGDNTYSFGDTSLNLQTGDQLHFELRADNVALKGNNLGVPYFSAMIQRGQFRDVITDAVYVASDIKAKLETLVSPNKLAKTAIQDAVLSVNSQYGDVLVTTTSIGAQPLDATLTALASQVTSADGLTYSTGVDTFSQTVFTPYARTLLDDTTSAQARATLELGSIATQNAENISITGGSVTGITDIAISDGGTGSSTASGARANLGLGTIATQDSNNVNITGGSVSGITDLAVSDGGTGASTASQARTNLGLVIGTNVQAQDAFLTSIASLGTASDKIIYTTGVDTAAETSLTPFARTLIDDIDGATMRGTLGLGSIATQNANSVAITGGSVTGISDILIADGGTGASTALGARTNLGIITGTYTPTLFNTTNVAASQAYQFQYMQIGDMVQVTGKVDIDPTNNNQSTVLGVSLPIASNLGAEEDCSGVGACPDVAGQVGAILGDITNDRATIQFVSGSSLNHKMMISFMYQVI